MSVKKAVEFIKECKAEIKRVVFPSRSQTIAAAFGVISFSVFMAIYLGILDFLFSRLIGKLLTF